MTTGRLQDQIAIVTGGAGGIGAATCRQLAAAGAIVVVTDILPAPTTPVRSPPANKHLSRALGPRTPASAKGDRWRHVCDNLS